MMPLILNSAARGPHAMETKLANVLSRLETLISDSASSHLPLKGMQSSRREKRFGVIDEVAEQGISLDKK